MSMRVLKISFTLLFQCIAAPSIDLSVLESVQASGWGRSTSQRMPYSKNVRESISRGPASYNVHSSMDGMHTRGSVAGENSWKGSSSFATTTRRFHSPAVVRLPESESHYSSEVLGNPFS